MLSEYEFYIEYLKGKENKVANFLSRVPHQKVLEDIQDLDIESLFENSFETIESRECLSNEKFILSDSIVNKYLMQIRIVKKKIKEYDKLFGKYKIIFIEQNDLKNNHYLNDILRRYIKKGTIGIYSELGVDQNVFIEHKLINLFCGNKNIKFTKCSKLAFDVENKKDLIDIIECTHINGNHRGINENFEEIKFKFFYPNLKKWINKYINSCRICIENKYERKPFKKMFQQTTTPKSPNEIVHVDIFQICKTYFLTTIDRFTKLASIHKISDMNMCTVKVKLEERISMLGTPKLFIMDNQFNNALIRMFCREKNIEMHFTTPNSHTGNSDVERLHSTLLEHIRILKDLDKNQDIEEIVVRAVGYYNNTIHSLTKLKPIDFINKTDIDYQELSDIMKHKKEEVINNINKKRENVPNFSIADLYIKNPRARRQKIAKRFLKYNNTNRNINNKIDFNLVRRPLKQFP